MKKLSLFTSLVFLSVLAFSQKQFVVDPNAEMRSINGNFNKIKVSHAIDLYLSQADNISLAVSASEDKYKENIKTVVENNVLKIYYEGDRKWIGKDRKVKVYVSFKNIEELEASGASDIVVAGIIKADHLKLNLSGASDFSGKVDTRNIDVETSGASDLKVSGNANVLTISSSGASDFHGYELETESCVANCSGSSDVEITVSKEISVKASGASNIYFKGSATMKDIQTSGASKVNKRG
ncbi:MAG: head GIN domain-containing protein [Ferruginibacter sp.]